MPLTHWHIKFKLKASSGLQTGFISIWTNIHSINYSYCIRLLTIQEKWAADKSE